MPQTGRNKPGFSHLGRVSRVEAQTYLVLRIKFGEVSQAGTSATRGARSASRPIGGRKIYAPKMRGGRKKFYADALPLLGEVADKNYAALLLLFGNRVDQYNVRAQFHFG